MIVFVIVDYSILPFPLHEPTVEMYESLLYYFLGGFMELALIFPQEKISFGLNFVFHRLFQQFFDVIILGQAFLSPKHSSSFLLSVDYFHFQVVGYILEAVERI